MKAEWYTRMRETGHLHRPTDPATSKAAAKRASRVAADEKVGRALLEIMREVDISWTDEQLAWYEQGYSASRVRHGRLYLERHGYIEDTGERARTSAGGTTRLWRLSDKGKA